MSKEKIIFSFSLHPENFESFLIAAYLFYKTLYLQSNLISIERFEQATKFQFPIWLRTTLETQIESFI